MYLSSCQQHLVKTNFQICSLGNTYNKKLERRNNCHLTCFPHEKQENWLVIKTCLSAVCFTKWVSVLTSINTVTRFASPSDAKCAIDKDRARQSSPSYTYVSLFNVT